MAVNSLPKGFVLDNSASSLPEGFTIDQPETPQEQPKERSVAGEIARPFLRAGRSIAAGIGGIGDIAQEAAYLPEAIGRSAARGLGYDVEPFDTSKVNTVSPAIRKGFDELTGGLTTPRSKTEEVVDIAGEIAGGGLGGAVGTVARKAVDIASLIGKRAFQKTTGITKRSKDLVKAFEETGVNPTLANIAEGQGTKSFQNLVGNAPGGRGAIERATQDQIDNITKQIAGITRSEGGTIPQAGKKIQEGAITIKTGVQGRINKLYDDLDEFVPKEDVLSSKDLPQIDQLGVDFDKYKLAKGIKGDAVDFSNKIPTTNLKTLTQDPQIQDVVAVGSGDTAKVLGRYNDIIDEAGNISYPRLKTFRSTVGAKLQSPTLLGDEKSALKKIYGALSEDMKEAVVAQGGKRGLQAFNKANKAFSRHTDLLDKKIDPLIKAKTTSKVYDLLLSGTKQGGTDARLIMRNLDPVQKDFVRGTVAREMGLANEGLQGAERATFSPNKFLTEYNKMRKVGTERNLFTPVQNEAFNKLNTVIESLKETSKARQSSNNLPYMTWAGLGGLTVASPIAGAGAVAGANITSKMMTNPKFIKWLAQTPKVKPLDVPKHLKQLSIISRSAKTPELSEDILNYLESITIEKENNGNK